jgi:L-glyceraldehyde 3-phosphate reductase
LNLLDRQVIDDGILDAVRQEGCGFVSFSPLAQGLLTDRYRNGIPADSRMRTDVTLKEEVLTPALQQQLHQFRAQAAQQGETLARFALRSVLDTDGVTSVIVGASSRSQLDENLKVLENGNA